MRRGKQWVYQNIPHGYCRHVIRVTGGLDICVMACGKAYRESLNPGSLPWQSSP
jgi:hypothetical protein